MKWVYIPKTQNIVLWYLVWLSHEGSINCANLDQCALFSVNTHTHTEWRKADFYFTSLFPSCFFNQAKLRNQWNGSYVVFFPFKKLVLFSSQAYVPRILSVSGVAGWLLHFSHWQKEAVWMGEIVSFVAYVVTGGTKVWGELAQPMVPGRQSPAQLTNSAQQRENVWKRRREECERERMWKGKRGTMLKRWQFRENVTHKCQGERWNAATCRSE